MMQMVVANVPRVFVVDENKRPKGVITVNEVAGEGPRRRWKGEVSHTREVLERRLSEE